MRKKSNNSYRPSKFVSAGKHSNWDKKVKTLEENDLFEMLDRLKEDPFILILDQVQDPHNLGACLRTADGTGVHAVITPKNKSAPVTDVVRKVSCGASENIPVYRVINLARVMKKLKKRGIWIVGTSDATKDTIYTTDLKGALAITMGAEGKGIRRLTMENCDFLVQIPMQGKVPCLNVSVATGVSLFEALRQRQNLSKKSL